MAVSTIRCVGHASALPRISSRLSAWDKIRPAPRGEIACSDAGFSLRRDPDTLVGVDVGYTSAFLAGETAGTSFFDGPPIPAVEILSPSDTHGDLVEKIRENLDAGPVVWEADPD